MADTNGHQFTTVNVNNEVEHLATLKIRSGAERGTTALGVWFTWCVFLVWPAALILMALAPKVSPLFGTVFAPGYWTCWAICALVSALRLCLPSPTLFR